MGYLVEYIHTYITAMFMNNNDQLYVLGNLGLLDQKLAIEWVYNNIRDFGGDPDQITLMGHGSGAASVMFHMTSSLSSSKILQVVERILYLALN